MAQMHPGTCAFLCRSHVWHVLHHLHEWPLCGSPTSCACPTPPPPSAPQQGEEEPLYEQVLRAWQNERYAPELLPYPTGRLEALLERVGWQQQRIDSGAVDKVEAEDLARPFASPSIPPCPLTTHRESNCTHYFHIFLVLWGLCAVFVLSFHIFSHRGILYRILTAQGFE